MTVELPVDELAMLNRLALLGVTCVGSLVNLLYAQAEGRPH